MPWRLIVIIAVCAILLGFVGLNLENKCVLNLGFGIETPPVPVFFIIFISFMLGMLCSLPFFIFASRRKPKFKEKFPKVQSSQPSFSPEKRFPATPDPMPDPEKGPNDID